MSNYNLTLVNLVMFSFWLIFVFLVVIIFQMNSIFRKSLAEICSKITKNPCYSEEAARIHTASIISCVGFIPGGSRKRLINALLEKDSILAADEIEYLNHLMFDQLSGAEK